MANIPDQTLHMEAAMRLAQEARTNAGPLHPDAPTPVDLPKGETANQVFPGVVAPIYLGNEKDLIPERYIIHYEFVQCRNCGAATRASKFYGLTYLRSRINGSRVRHLTPCSSARFNVPVDKKLTGCSTIPYCQECDGPDLSHLPPPPDATSLYDLAEPRLKGAKPKDPSKPSVTPVPAKKKPSLDDLI